MLWIRVAYVVGSPIVTLPKGLLMLSNDPDGELRPILRKSALSWSVPNEIRATWQIYTCVLPSASTAAISMCYDLESGLPTNMADVHVAHYLRGTLALPALTIVAFLNRICRVFLRSCQ
jgi:hypothetical protein